MDGGTGQGLGNGVSQESSRKFSQVLRSPHPGETALGQEGGKEGQEGGRRRRGGGREQEEVGGGSRFLGSDPALALGSSLGCLQR